jgi:hypothetical protein
MNLPTLSEIETAAQIVYRAMPPTPQFRRVGRSWSACAKPRYWA